MFQTFSENDRTDNITAASTLEPDNSEVRLLTGIEGLDDILNGGIPRGHLYLIEGDPGTGKTTLALQFLLEGARAGEKGIYVTLSESKIELEQVARSHGWDITPITIYEMIPSDEDLSPEAQYTVFHPSEVELADTITAILKQIEFVDPRRVVFDSLSEFRMLARDPLKYRRQILALKRYFAGRNCTVLLLDDRTAEGDSNDLQLQSIAHGVIKMQSLERDFGIKRRRLEVHKLRGSHFREGYHDYTIRTGGLATYPRLIASEHMPGFKRNPILSGLPELDDLLQGGLDSGTSSLLIGPAGCGKSTIALRYAYTSAQRGEKAVIFTFDESLSTLIDRGKHLGMDPTELICTGKLEMHQIDPAELSPGEFVSRIRRMVDDDGLRMVVIDSMNGFLNAMPHEQFLAMQLHELLAYLGQQGIATLLTLAQHGFIGTTSSPIDVSYLADTVLLFRYFERAGAIRNAISVLKKRSGPHERTIRELVLGEGTIKVGPPLDEFEGVLTGNPTYIGKSGKETPSDSGK
ncbi:circadian clock protein KaiC [Bryocella elongata]|uniref:non-specific serine/threonine protein kinase n=1 Tax=Bryocella elongata TaxID=863522 RepID=A0A1H5UNM0_9BACT|nr:ATPase domain-containing protein [Bryocella elongata]SEF76616.1 circadian clock protein KaiC [Bryocella elongata]